MSLGNDLTYNQKYHEIRKNKEESDIFEKAKKNKNVLFNYLKKKNKTKQNIGPLKDGKKILSEHPCVTLTKQYEKVFSTPLDKFKIDDLDIFFMNKCELCEKETVHMCESDMFHFEKKSYRYELSDIAFDEKTFDKVMRNIEPNLSCGLDGIPGIIFNKFHESLALPMSLIWSESLKVGKIP